MVFFIDPLELNLPLLDRMYKEMVDPSEEMKSLRNKINDAEGYLAVTPEYNHSTSSAMKSYSPERFGEINAAQQLRLVFAKLAAPSISSSFPIPRVHKAFDEDGRLLDEAYEKRVSKFLAEFEWYIEALKNQRAKGTPY
jgi:NAD(P)H-dependent FMN reductase